MDATLILTANDQSYGAWYSADKTTCTQIDLVDCGTHINLWARLTHGWMIVPTTKGM